MTAGEAIEGAIDDISNDTRTLVGHVEGDHVREPGAAQGDSSVAAAKGIVDEVPEGLPEPCLIAEHHMGPLDIHDDVPTVGCGTIDEPVTDGVERGVN